MESVNCPFCRQKLDDLKISEREDHVFSCIGNTSQVIPPTHNPKPPTPPPKQRRICKLCSNPIQGSLKW